MRPPHACRKNAVTRLNYPERGDKRRGVGHTVAIEKHRFFEPFDTHDARADTQPWGRSKMSPVPERFDRMNALLIIVFSLIFPITHIANGWIFEFAEVSSHISLIYLPAFVRLANVLVLGPLKGTLATFMGGLLLAQTFDEPFVASTLNICCSASGPLISLCIFKMYSRRNVHLTSIKDLGVLTLMYALSNAVLHHLVWSVVDPSKLSEPIQVVWMVLGDIFGALLGAYLMKWCILKYRQVQVSRNL